MQAAVKDTRPPPVPPDVAAAWGAVQRFMVRTCGVVLDDEQVYLLDARLAGVAKQHHFVRIADFVSAACAAPVNGPLAQALIEAMTTHETLFFRDPPFWKNMETIVLPRLVERAKTVPVVRIWSAACSTGQEPYSIAMLVAEKFPDLANKLEIVATDVAEPSVARAKEGVYGSLETNRGLSSLRLVKHFEQVVGGYRIRDGLRARITWATHNLLGSRPDPVGCDLVLCRNVLIYFGETDRAAVIKRLMQAAIPGGLIGVGSTETLKETPVATGLYTRT